MKTYVITFFITLFTFGCSNNYDKPNHMASINNIKDLEPKVIYCPVTKVEELSNLGEFGKTYSLNNKKDEIFLFDNLTALNIEGKSYEIRHQDIKGALLKSIESQSFFTNTDSSTKDYIYNSGLSSKEVVSYLVYSLSSINYLIENDLISKNQTNDEFLSVCNIQKEYNTVMYLKDMFKDNPDWLIQSLFISSDLTM